MTRPKPDGSIPVRIMVSHCQVVADRINDRTRLEATAQADQVGPYIEVCEADGRAYLLAWPGVSATERMTYACFDGSDPEPTVWGELGARFSDHPGTIVDALVQVWQERPTT